MGGFSHNGETKMKLKFTKEELESIIVEHNDKEDDINLHISTIDDIAKAILLEIYVSTPTFCVLYSLRRQPPIDHHIENRHKHSHISGLPFHH
jgi:hypothetical protein